VTLLQPGSKIGRFEISGVLGEGAMGVVYLGHDPQIERPVAIKTLRPAGSQASADELKERFLKEAKLSGRLQHPNIVTIYEAGQADSLLYIAMEYVDGDPLTRFLTAPKDPLSLRERVEVVREVALALEHAHARGVLHRDVKPGNILLTRDNHVKVADFGIGKLLSGSADLTRTGQMIGSPAYMSPEQVKGEKLDGRSDFFSLGVVFYELLTGVRPFPGDSITTLVYQILHTEPRDPLEVRKDLPPATRDVFARLLAKSPDKRPPNAAEFLREVKRIGDQLAEVEQTLSFAAGVPIPPDERPTRKEGVPTAAPTPPLPPAAAPPARTPPPPPVGPSPSPSAPRPSHAPAPKGGAHLLLFGLAALLLAAAAFLVVWQRSRGGSGAGDVAANPPTPAGPAAGGAIAPTAAPSVPTPAPEITLAALPTPGPSAAADAVVGAPRYTTAPPTRVRRSTPTEAPRVAVVPPPPPPPVEPREETRPSHESAGPTPDNSYRTRRYAKIGVSPDQARMYVDGRYVGIADDWDDRGGGRKYEFTRDGAHRLRFELPGYRDLNVEVLVTRGADDDTADVGDELKRETRGVSYPKIGGITDRTIGPVVFQVDPPEAVVTEGGKALGPASSFTASSPLKLSGPAVHDLVLSAPGRQSKTVRILVSSTADQDHATVKVELKK
jgi:serine/threonine protein kinase